MVCNQQNWKSCLELKKIYDADVTMTTLCDVTVTQFNGKQFYPWYQTEPIGLCNSWQVTKAVTDKTTDIMPT